MPLVQNPSYGSGASPLLVSSVLLTASQVVNLFNTPVVLIPAPGAGKIIVPIFGAISLNLGSIPFNGNGADQLTIGYATSGDNAFPNSFNGIIEAAQSAILAQSAGYTNPLDISPGDDNQAIQLTALELYNTGPILTTTLGAGGTGYAINDTGSITTGNGDATYKVLTVGALGAVATYAITFPGTEYSTGAGQATATGGAQPGVGINFTVNVTAVSPGNGSVRVTVYYQIIPVP